jgi:hypothetical protein
MILSEKERKPESSDEQIAAILRRLSLRWKLLQGVGAALIALSLMVEWPLPSDPALPATQPFLLILGVLVFVAGLFGGRYRGIHA